MNGIISGIKNIVIMIVASEFIKAFMIEDSFKKYITICVNIIVIGFIIGEIKNVPFSFHLNYDMPNYEAVESKNTIRDEYEKRLNETIKKRLENEKISVYDIKTVSNEDYSIKSISVNINANKEKAEKIIEGMKAESYEIYVNNQ